MIILERLFLLNKHVATFLSVNERTECSTSSKTTSQHDKGNSWFFNASCTVFHTVPTVFNSFLCCFFIISCGDCNQGQLTFVSLSYWKVSMTLSLS